MALVFSDRVKETTTSTGTGPLTLAGAVAGFRAFSSVCADGDTAYYVVTDGTSWEVGLGTFAAGVLTRTSVLASSNGGVVVALNPGSKEVWIDVPAAAVDALRGDIATALSTANDARNVAVDAQTLGSYLSPACAAGDPTSAGAPTDGSVLYYFDSTTSPYVMWVFDSNDNAFHQVA